MIVIRSFYVHIQFDTMKKHAKYEHICRWNCKVTLEILFIFAYNGRAKVGNEH